MLNPAVLGSAAFEQFWTVVHSWQWVSTCVGHSCEAFAEAASCRRRRPSQLAVRFKPPLPLFLQSDNAAPTQLQRGHKPDLAEISLKISQKYFSKVEKTFLVVFRCVFLCYTSIVCWNQIETILENKSCPQLQRDIYAGEGQIQKSLQKFLEKFRRFETRGSSLETKSGRDAEKEDFVNRIEEILSPSEEEELNNRLFGEKIWR